MNRRYLLIFTVTIVLLMALLLYACAQPAPTPKPVPSPSPVTTSKSAEPIKLKFSYDQNQGSPPTNGWHWLGDEMSKRSQGRLTITFFPSGALFKTTEAIENIVAGTADLAMVSVKIDAKRLPLTSGTLLPFNFPQTANGWTAQCNALQKLYNEFPEIQAEFKGTGAKFMWFDVMPANVVHSIKPIRVPKDFKGIKVGASGVIGDLVQSQGGAAVPVIPPDSYLNIKTGVIQAQINAWNAVADAKLWEVVDYHTEAPLGTQILPVIMNINSWNKLPADIQNMLTELIPDQIAVSNKLFEEVNEKSKQYFVNDGDTILKLTSDEIAQWLAVCEPMENKWVADCEAKGLNSARKILDRYKQLAAQVMQ